MLTQNIYDFGSPSFDIISEFPNKKYFAMLEKYYKVYFYQWYRADQKDMSKADFIHSLASYKNKESAAILNQILHRKPFMPFPMNSQYVIRENLYYSILNNPCKAYLQLAEKSEIKRFAKDNEVYLKGGVPYDRINDLKRW